MTVEQVDTFTLVDGLDEGDKAVGVEERDRLEGDERLCGQHGGEQTSLGVVDWTREASGAGGVHHY